MSERAATHRRYINSVINQITAGKRGERAKKAISPRNCLRNNYSYDFVLNNHADSMGRQRNVFNFSCSTLDARSILAPLPRRVRPLLAAKST